MANTFPIGLSNVNVELSYSANTTRAFDDAIFRSLSGNTGVVVPESRIGFSDIDGKVAFNGFTYTTVNTNVSTFGSATPTSSLQVLTDMYGANIIWSYSVVSGDINIKLVPSGTSALLSLTTNDIGTLTSNVAVTAALSYNGHLVGTNTQYITLSGTVSDPALTLSGVLSVNNSGYAAQSATTSLTASANASLDPTQTQIQFIVDPGVGTSISGNTITFNCFTNVPGNDNTQSYSVTTNLFFQNNLIASNTTTVVVRSTFLVPNLNFVAVNGVTNNQFANSGNLTSSLVFTADHNVVGANVVWSAQTVSGTPVSIVTSANNESATFSLSIANGTYGFSKSISNVTATLQYANGMVLVSNTSQITLRVGTYGLNFTPPTALVVANGYNAQTATTTANATWQAGTFSWYAGTVSGLAANVSKLVTAQSSSSISLSINTGAAFANVASVVQINPVITYDGIVVANVASVSTLNANYLPYSYTISGNTVNNQIGTTAQVIQTVSQNVVGGSVVFSTNNHAVTLVSNATAATLTLANTSLGANIQTANLLVTLLDNQARVVNTQIIPVTLRIYVANTSFSGANNVSVIGYSANQSANVTVGYTPSAGANSVTLSAKYVSGANAVITYVNNTSINVQVSEPYGVVGTAQGFYQIISQIGFYDKSLTLTYPISVAATILDSGLTLATSNGSSSTFGPTSVANAQVTATFAVPNGTVKWSGQTISGNPAFVSSNSSSYNFSAFANSIGTQTSVVFVTATLVDANGLFVVSKTANVSATAIFSDPQLTLTGNTRISVANSFGATAAATVTASVNPAFTNAQYSFSLTKISGADATITIGASTVTLRVDFNGVGSSGCVYNLSCSVSGSNSTPSETVSTQFNLTAAGSAPTLYLNPSSASNTSYNYPVVATATATAQSNPQGYIVWGYSLISGSSNNVVVTSNTSTSVGSIAFTMSTSAIGAQSAVYNVVANYYSPNGVFLASQNTNVSVSATRLNPNFQITYPLGQTVTQYGWEQTLGATTQALASVDPAVPTANLIYNWTLTQANGAVATVFSNNTSGLATITIGNDRTANGTVEVDSAYTATCSVSLNGQQIGGPLPAILYAKIIPYYINLIALPSNNSVTTDANSVITVAASTNSPAAANQSYSWTVVKTSGTGTDTIVNTANSQVLTLSPPPFIGQYTSYYSLNVSLVANGATRTSNTVTTYQAANSTTNSTGG